MNVLLVVPEYPPNVIGGGGAVYARIAEHLRSRGHGVMVIFGDFTNRSWFARSKTHATPDGLQLTSVPLMPNPKRLSWMLSAMPPTPQAAADVLRFFWRENWEVAHLHGVGFPLVDMCAALLRCRHIPYVYTVHGIPSSPWRRSWPARIGVRNYLRIATGRTVRGAVRTTAVSAALLNDTEFPIAHGKVIPNGIDLPPGSRPAPASQARGEGLRLLSISRLSLNKGIDVAIRAVAMLRQTQRIEYDIYGSDGGDESVFRALVMSLGVGADIRFCGTFGPDARSEIFARYDALLVPSRVEGFGLAALEALAAGLPVIANPVDGLGEFLSHENAILVKDHDPASWKAALEEFAKTTAVTASLRAAAGRATARDFSWDNVLGVYERELQLAISPPNAHYGKITRAAI